MILNGKNNKSFMGILVSSILKWVEYFNWLIIYFILLCSNFQNLNKEE